MASLKEYRFFALMALFIVTVFLPGIAVAQDGTGIIFGTVTGPAGGVISDCSVTIQGINVETTTGLDGSYRLAPVPVGEWTMVFNYLGLQAGTATVTVVAGEAVSQDMSLMYAGEIEVRGSPILVGQAKALNKQKNAINITNVISSAQMGEFPDKNAAEAAQRIPGLTLSRDMGEGRYVLVRGTEPRLNATTINGERLPSPEKDRRDVALDTIPADLLESIEVSKVLTPDMDGDSIGGTVNLVTRRAPEEVKVSASLGLIYSELSEEFGYNGTFGWGQRFADNKFGILLSGSTMEQERETHNIEPEYDDGWLDELQYRAYDTTRQRNGFTGDFDWKVSDRSSYYMRALYTNYQDDEIRRRVKNKVAKEQISRDLKERLQESDILSLTLGGENIIGESMVIDYHFARNTAKEETANQIISAFKQKDVIFDPNVSPDHIDPSNIQANPLNEDYNDSKFDEIERQYKVAEEKDWVGAFNLTQGFYRDAGFSGLWKAGAKVRLKTKDQDVNVWIGELDDDLYLNEVLGPWTPATSFFGGTYDIGLFQDPTLMRDLWNSGILETERILEEDLADFTSTEDTYAGFGMGEFILGGKTTVVGGLRVEHTKTHYDAWELAFDEEGDPLELLPVSAGNSYTEWLPQFSLVHRLSEQSNLRAGLTRTLARPNFDQLAPFRLINFEDQELQMGNQDLKVTTAWNLDLMYELYLKPVGIFSAGLFYKDLANNIFMFTIDQEIDGNIWEVTQPLNGDDATLWGFEIAYQNQFTQLKGALGGLGLYANYTYIDSETMFPDHDMKSPLQGQSENIANMSLVYEKYGFSGRLSFNYTGKYIVEVGGAPDEDLWVDNHFQIDFTARQQLSKKFGIYLELVNLNNEPFIIYQGVQDRIRQQEFYGWWGTVGVRFNL